MALILCELKYDIIFPWRAQRWRFHKGHKFGVPVQAMPFCLLVELKISLDFVKHDIREYEMGGSNQMKVVSIILQSFA